MTTKSKFVKFFGYIIFALLAILVIAWNEREFILTKLGRMLIHSVEPYKGDVIVILRGDPNFVRAQEAEKLFKRDFGEFVLIPSSLSDKILDEQFKKNDINLPIPQQNLKTFLLQRGVPEEKIILGHMVPGGGTLGEAQRVKQIMKTHEFKTALIVTNWWHTRRTRAVYRTKFEEDGLKAVIVSAENDLTDPSNWWKFRYESIRILEEFPKFLIFFLSPSSDLNFPEDPQ